MKVEIDLPEIAGCEYTGEYRQPKSGELFSREGEMIEATVDLHSEYPILRKKEKLRIVIYQWLVNKNTNSEDDAWDCGYQVLNGTVDYMMGLSSKYGWTYKKMSETPIWSLPGDTL